jgi:dihydroneopterin aldolase
VTGAADRIELRGLVVMAYCGVLAHEQTDPQPIEIDVDIYTDLGAAGESDDLGDTVDYGAICARVADATTSERFALLERLAARVAQDVLDDGRVLAVTVAARKLRPPVPQQLETSGVRITRER